MVDEAAPSTADSARMEAVRELHDNRVLAHQVLFKHRHRDETPEFHREMVELTHSGLARLAIKAFRGGAKSTVVCEEATLVMALLGEFRNGLIVGEKYERAAERLKSIRHELETNEAIRGLFGEQEGETWTEGKLVLRNGVVLQAIGRSQSLRGSKHHDQRPDYAVLDDIEDAESVRSEESKRETLAWVLSVLVPAMDKVSRVRVIGTPLETDSLMEALGKDEGWTSRSYPIEYVDGEGERRATWPGRFPLEDIAAIRKTFERHGMLLEYGREYMMEARSGETRVFTKDMLRVVPEIRKPWYPVYCYYDPARSVKETSAHTGKAVWSWLGARLVVWEAVGRFWRPDEIVSDMYETQERYGCVAVGVEPDGLEEFLMQPIRQEGVKRGVLLPLRAVRAPKGKDDFIRGLQPFFQSGEATMAVECPELVAQLLNFPVGRKDVPNALAYALRMRPGLPVYEDFTALHVLEADRERRLPGRWTAACNWSQGVLTGVLMQRDAGRLVVQADMVLEGDTQQRCEALCEWVRTESGGDYEVVVHPDHFERYGTSGLVGALRRLRVEPRRGGDCVRGRGWLVSKLQARRGGQVIVQVSERAKWTLNGLLGGYCFEMAKSGSGLQDRAPEGVYRTLMEGLEAWAGLSAMGGETAEEGGNYATDRHGNRYLSSMPQRG